MRLFQAVGFCALIATVISRASATDYTAVYLYELPANQGTTGVAIGGVVVGSTATSLKFYPSSATGIDLTPTNLPSLTASYADATDGTHVVGGAFNTNGLSHPLLWNTPGNTPVDLMPASGFTNAEAVSVSGSQQAGNGSGPATGNQTHAMIWSGTAASYVDLNPANFQDSYALATDGTHQAGYGHMSDGLLHGLLWNGDNHATDLGIGGYAEGLKGTQVVGRADFPNQIFARAAVWNGAVSASILNTLDGQTSDIYAPTWFWRETDAVATNGSQQVGYGEYDTQPNLLYGTEPTSSRHALVWNGPGSTGVDLNSYLPSDFMSRASSIDDAGDIFGVAMGPSNVYVVEWIPTPEPTAAWLLGAGAATALLRRRSRRCCQAALPIES